MNRPAILLALALFFTLPVLEACHKSSCPTYDLSGPTKKRKKRKKDNVQPWESRKVQRMDNGDARSGVAPD